MREGVSVRGYEKGARREGASVRGKKSVRRESDEGGCEKGWEEG